MEIDLEAMTREQREQISLANQKISSDTYRWYNVKDYLMPNKIIASVCVTNRITYFGSTWAVAAIAYFYDWDDFNRDGFVSPLEWVNSKNRKYDEYLVNEHISQKLFLATGVESNSFFQKQVQNLAFLGDSLVVSRIDFERFKEAVGKMGQVNYFEVWSFVEDSSKVNPSREIVAAGVKGVKKFIYGYWARTYLLETKIVAKLDPEENSASSGLVSGGVRG